MSATNEADFRGCVDETWARPWKANFHHPKHMIKAERARIDADFEALETKKARQGGEYTEDDVAKLSEITGKYQLLDDAENGRPSVPNVPGGPMTSMVHPTPAAVATETSPACRGTVSPRSC